MSDSGNVFTTKEQHLREAYQKMQAGEITTEAYMELVGQIHSSDLPDGNLTPSVRLCGNGNNHVHIVTCAGTSKPILAMNIFSITCDKLFMFGLITEDDAEALKAEVAEKMPSLKASTLEDTPAARIFEQLGLGPASEFGKRMRW